MRHLRTSLCTLEPQVTAHAAEMFEVLCDPAIYEFEGVPPPSVEALTAGYAKSESRLSPDQTEQWLNWVVRASSGELTGYVQAQVLPSGASCIGYEFASRFWRRGLASASVGAMLTELSSTYRVHTFVALLKKRNFRSMGLLRKLGFVEGSASDFTLYKVPNDETVLVSYAPCGDA